MPESSLPPLDLQAPLPAEVAGRHQGWFTRYRRYPVFSPQWARGRWLAVGPVLLLAWMALLLPPWMAVDPGEGLLPLGGIAQLSVNLFLPFVFGPWLGVAVRRRAWPARREWAGLVAAVAACVLAVAAFNEWLSEPMKQTLAEWTGQVDASGKRKRLTMMLGVTITSAERRRDGQPPPPDTDRQAWARTSSALSLGALSFWLAGGAALWGWRRERAGLEALARERELARAQAELREAELRLSVLAAQVEPHFLFNTLAGVRSAIATDPARASEMVDRLVEYLRAAIPRLRSDGQVQATLGAQLDIVRAYLGLMASRMPRLQWSIDVPPELLRARCPPLMLISLAENAVKHGVERKIGPARIEVRAARSDDGRLQVTVQDDGPGFDGGGAGGSGLGLANIRERLQQLFPGQGTLQLRARSEGGVAASLLLPLEFDDVRSP